MLFRSQTMTFPLIVLAVLSIAAGYVGIPEFLAPVFAQGEAAAAHHGEAGTVIMIIATLMGLTGIAGAYYVYVLNPQLPEQFASRWKALYEGSLNKWYVDEAYDRAFVRPTVAVAADMWKRIDVAVIDGAVNGIARGIAWGGWLLRLIQSGQTQHYALAMALGLVVLVTVFLVF